MSDNLDGVLNGTDLFGEPIRRAPAGPLAERFLFPPFSILDARSGDWQARKKAWIAIGLRGEMGRGEDLIGWSAFDDEWYASKHGVKMNKAPSANGTSIFDPTLCECIYRWFSAPGAHVVDPFAGGSVRGIVAAMLGRRYWGCDLRAEQVEANREQAREICPDAPPVWVCGDSMDALASAPDADLIFSCPPYGDLERYSNDPADLSAMEWHTFRAAYGRIILRAVQRLKQDRFACFVVGDFRDKRGFYRDFVSATISAFRDAGADLYNEAVLVTQGSTASLRASRYFNAGRKLVKTHQNVLVFCKGDWRRAAAAAAAGEVDA